MKSEVNLKRVTTVVQRFLVVGYALAVLALFLYLLQTPEVSTAAPDAPDAPGLIAGQVVNDQGQPVPDTIVGLYRYPYTEFDSSAPYPTPLKTVRTNAAGHYTFTLVNSGVYRLLFRDWQHVYARQYYSGSSYLQTASELSVFGKTITNINAVLIPGAIITGNLIVDDTKVDISRYSETQVELFEKIGEEWRRVEAITLYLSQSRMPYTLSGLASGAFRLCARFRSATPPVHGCYGLTANGSVLPNGQDQTRPNVEQAADITITAGNKTSNIDVALYPYPQNGPEQNGMGIKGQVTTEDGRALSYIYILVRNAPSGVGGDYVYTRLDGNFFVPLSSPGDYILFFQSGYNYGNTFWSEYYNNAATYGAATPVHVEQGQQVTGINAQLARTGNITGVVSFIDNDFPGTYTFYAILYQKSGARWERQAETYIDTTTGRYAFQGLDAGSYRVGVAGYLMVVPFGTIVDEYLSNFYGGGTTVEQASDIVLAHRSDSRTNINILVGENQFEGRISGVVSVNGAAKPSIKVEFFRSSDFVNVLTNQPILYLMTDSAGHYAVDGLLNGRYQVKFSDPTGVYATTYYNNSPSLQAAQTLTITGKTAYSDINAALILGGTIQGSLIHSDGKPVAKAQVDLLWQGAARAAPAVVGTVKTNDRGEFALAGVYPGVYQMRFTSARFRPNSIMYGTFNPTTGNYDPMSVTVGGGQVMNTPMQVAAPTMVETAPEPTRLFLPILVRE